MLVKASPKQVSENWDKIRPMIVETLPPSLRISLDGVSNILSALMKGEAEFWTYYQKEGDGRPLAILVTTKVVDKVAGAPYMLIYSMHALARISSSDYLDGISTLKKYAAEQGCKEVIAYVENDAFIRVLQQFGGVKVTNLVRL